MYAEIISRQEAKNQELKFYFTGKPCKHGHVEKRRVSNKVCLTCEDNWPKANPEKCKEYVKKYSENNKEKKDAYAKYYRETFPEKRKESREKSREKNLEKYRESARNSRQKNIERYKEVAKAYRVNNPDKVNAKTARRRVAKLLASPFWRNELKILEFYKIASLKTEETKIKHHVDHIVPLKNRYVCGLHNEFNLEVLTAKENQSKGNRYWPYMSEETPELKELADNFYAQSI
jgi:hypothetical protein